jgi:hypothetical protein
MTLPSVLGRTTPGSIQVTPEMILAISQDRPTAECCQNDIPGNLGQTNTPIHVLPSLELEE